MHEKKLSCIHLLNSETYTNSTCDDLKAENGQTILPFTSLLKDIHLRPGCKKMETEKGMQNFTSHASLQGFSSETCNDSRYTALQQRLSA